MIASQNDQVDFVEVENNSLGRLTLFSISGKWDKVFKNGPSEVCGRLSKVWSNAVGLNIYNFKFFKGCLTEILLGPFLNTLFQILNLTD